MPLVLADRVRDTTTTTGTGTITLSGTAPTGYQNFSVIGNGNTTYYTINAGSQWEVGIGTYSDAGPTLARTTVLESSSGGSLVNFSAGVKDVFVTYPADKSVNYDENNNVGIGTSSVNLASGRGMQINAPAGQDTRLKLTNVDSGTGSFDGFDLGLAVTGAVNLIGWEAQPMSFYTNGTERARIDSSGNLLVGTTTTAYGTAGRGLIEVNGSSTALIAIKTGDTARGYFAASSSATELSAVGASQPLLFTTNSAERMRITAAGGLAVGTTTDPGAGNIGLAAGGRLQFSSSAYVTPENNVSGAEISTPGAITFRTGSGTPERARFDDSGNLLIGTTTSTGKRLTLAGSADISMINTANTSGFDIGLLGGSSDATAFIYQRANSALAFGTNNATRLTIGSGGEITANVDIRAPIFYDSNNTAFYLDPAAGGTSANFASTVVIGGSYARSLAHQGYLNGQYGTVSSNFTVNPIYCISGGFAPSSATNLGNMYGIGYADGGQSGVWAGGNWGLYVAENGTARHFLDATAGIGYATGSYRAPIFYDSNDTGYYIDPANTAWSGFFAGNLGFPNNTNAGIRNAAADAWVWVDDAFGNFFIKNSTGGFFSDFTTYNFRSTASALWGYMDSAQLSHVSSIRAPIFYDSNNTAFYLDPASTSVLNGVSAGTVSATNFTASNAFYVNGFAYYLNSTNGGWYSNARIQSETDMRAPIFYDSNNTAFYVDPTGTSRLNNLSLDTVAVTSGITGLTSAPITTQYANAGTTNTWYPMTYQRAQYADGYVTHLNTGLYKSVNAWGSGGTGWYAAIGGNDSYPTQAWYLTYDAYIQNSLGYVLTGGSFRAPIFYDIDNTAFYVDPASDTRLSAVYARGQVRATGWWGSYSASPTGLGIEIGQSAGRSFVLSYNRDVANYGPMSFEATDYFFANISGSFVRTDTSFRAPIFYDSNNTAYFLDPNTTGNALRTAGWWRQDSTDWGGDIGGKIQYHGNNWYFNAANEFIFRASNGSQPFYVTQSGAAIAQQDMRAPIFYDLNNTGFYVDPTGTSVMADAVIGGRTMSTAMFYAGFTLDANTMPSNSTGFTYQNNAPYFGPIMRAGQPAGGGYDMWFNAPYTGGNGLSFRTRDGDNNIFNAWQSVAVYNSNRASGDLYANIYYDNQNTAFYTDPSGISVMNVVRANSIQFPNGQTAIQLDNSSYQIFRSPDGGIRLYLGGADPANYYDNDAHIFRNRATTQIASISGSGVFAPIYYDLNNSAFYADPADNSVFRTLTVSANDNSTGGGVAFGGTASAQFIRGRNSDGASATLSNLQLQSWFGIGFGPSISGQAVPIGENAAWIDCRNGDLYGRRLVIAGQDVRAPLYYDSQNTFYYVDPGSTSNMNVLQLHGSIPMINGVSPPNSAIRLTPNLHLNAGAGSAVILNWDNGTTSGLTFRIGNGAGSDVFYVFANGHTYAPIYYDINNSAYYVDPNSNSRLNVVLADGILSYGNVTANADLVVGNGQNASYIYMKDADEGDRIIHCNSNRIGFLTQGGGWGAWCTDAGDWQTDAGMFASIFYDINDTTYYLNLNGYSQVNGNGSVNGSAGAGLNIYSVSNNGAIMAFHKGGHFAVNMGLDSDNVFRIGGWSAAANRLQMDMSGNLTMAGNVTAFSDIRLKKDIETIEGALDLVSKMRGVRFTRIENEERNVGVIAQEMLEVVPEVVQQGVGDDDTLSVAYGNLVGVLIEAIKELTTRVAELEGK